MTETVFGPWRKSSRSGNEGACVELAWRKSSRSANESACVELAHTATSGAIRDSKNPGGGRLDVPLTDLIAAVKTW
ncbi:DUF397 domain-containing protein [Actinophytocola sediminis]